MLRVEQSWMQLGIDAETTYHAVFHKLDMGVRALLESVRLHKRAAGGGAIHWSDVVNVAGHRRRVRPCASMRALTHSR